MPWKPGQSGNMDGARKAKIFYAALMRAVLQDDGKRVRAAAEKLLDLAADGEAWAIKELRDTLDGRPAQILQGDDDAPVTFVGRIERVIIDGNAKRLHHLDTVAADVIENGTRQDD